MRTNNPRHPLAVVAAVTVVLAASGPASAATPIVYNGHAGLGASAYQHNQTDPEFLAAAAVKDGTSNTLGVLMADMGGQFR